MKITLPTDSYNDRRYGRPYIALIDFSDNPKGDATFGDWVGQPGDAGTLVLDGVQPGAIVMTGQKDHRGRNSAPTYRQVAADGTLSAALTKAEAYALSQEAEQRHTVRLSVAPPTAPAVAALDELTAHLDGAPAAVLDALAVVRAHLSD